MLCSTLITYKKIDYKRSFYAGPKNSRSLSGRPAAVLPFLLPEYPGGCAENRSGEIERRRGQTRPDDRETGVLLSRPGYQFVHLVRTLTAGRYGNGVLAESPT